METDANQQSQELTGQVAIVTGGGRGLGRETALSLTKAGARVAIIARSQDQLAETVTLIQEAGGHTIAIPADVTDRGAIQRAVEQTERELGAIDILVNSAGSLVAVGPAWEADPDIWWRDVEINLRGTFICTHAVLPSMVARHRGRIINFSSTAMPYLTAYDCSKIAISRFTHMLASETKELGISVFSIVDGPVRTAMMESLVASEAMPKWFPWLRDWANENWVPAERAAQLVLFLASGKGDALSGRYIGGGDNWPELVQRVDEIERDSLYVWNVLNLPQGQTKANEL